MGVLAEALAASRAGGLYVRGMLVRARDFEATPEDPFANDTLGRQEHVKAVCGTIAEMHGPAVVALDGGWGTGKTAFLRGSHHKVWWLGWHDPNTACTTPNPCPRAQGSTSATLSSVIDSRTTGGV